MYRWIERARHRREDDGVAIASALLALIAFITLGIVIASVTFRTLDITSTDKETNIAFAAAESGMDEVVALLTNENGADWPCEVTGSVGNQNTGSAGDYRARITYYDTYPVTSAPLSCDPATGQLGGWSGTNRYPKAALVEVVGDSRNARSAGLVQDINSARYLQSLLTLSRNAVDANFSKAIFSDSASNFGNNGTLNNFEGNIADVYINGDYDCDNSIIVPGSLVVNGDVSLANTCTFQGNVNAIGGTITQTGNNTIGGDAAASGGNISQASNSRISGNAYTVGNLVVGGTTVSGQTASTVGGRVYANMANVTTPSAESMPKIDWNASTTAAGWQRLGYVVQTVDGCSAANSAYDTALAGSTKTVIYATGCQFDWRNKNIVARTDVTLISDLGFEMAGTSARSNSTTVRNLYFIVPSNSSVASASCINNAPEDPGGISITNNTDFQSSVRTFFYTPCVFNIANNATLTGQVYAGKVYEANRLNLSFSPMQVPASTSDTSWAYEVSMVYKREVNRLQANVPPPAYAGDPNGPAAGGGGGSGAVSHTVTFNANGGTGTMSPQSSTAPTGLTANAFTNTGFTFAGWATTPTGAVAYANGASFPFTSDATLYAVWEENVYTVSFNSNGGTGTMAPQQASGPTALNSNLFTRSGFTFAGWSTTPSGVAEYADRATFPFSASGTLYATWQPVGVRVTFNGNGATSGAMSSQTETGPTALTPNTFVRDGYSFLGWATTSGATTAEYADEAVFPFSSTTTLFAIWSRNAYTVTFQANGGTGSMAPQASSAPAALSANTFTRTNYVFAGWSDVANGPITYAPGATYQFTENKTLHAKWYPVYRFNNSIKKNKSSGFNLLAGTPAVPSGAAVPPGGGTTIAAKPTITAGVLNNSDWNANGAITYKAPNSTGTQTITYTYTRVDGVTTVTVPGNRLVLTVTN